ncbi:MAG: hypothetical protein FWD69_07810 [Polyangiaceae bacterium]|nr:hypothetical protein [Polyangiaceae bacterium]
MESLGPVEELRAALETFVKGKERAALLLTTTDNELPLVVRSLDHMDGSSPKDIYLIDVSPLNNLVSYVDTVIENVRLQLEEVNQESTREGQELLAPLPAECQDAQILPLMRLRSLMAHITSWVPDLEDQRMVVSLLPSHISDRNAHAQIIGALAPLHERRPWSNPLRLILRDDRAEPLVEQILRKWRATGIYLYTTRVTISELADAIAADVANKNLSAQHRISALMQCAMFDMALGRHEEALDKYSTLFQYYDEHNETQMKAVVLQGVGDVFVRLKQYSTAREQYLLSLGVATDAQSMQLILNGAMLLGNVDMTLRAYDEAEHAYALGAQTAEKLVNGYVQADMLEKCGLAREAQGNIRGAVECWSAAADAARENRNDKRLASVLPRLIEICRLGGHNDLRASYDAELRAASARLKENRT